MGEDSCESVDNMTEELTKPDGQDIIKNTIRHILWEGETLERMISSLILEYNKWWDNTDKSVMADNVEKFIVKKYPECSETFESRWNKLTEISGSKSQTVYAWLNRSRKDVKIPFLKLCKIAVALGVDLADLLSGTDDRQ